MDNTYLKIYNASAGSGKTTTLTKEFLNLSLQTQSTNFFDEKYFKYILGLTFTNAVAKELKERIIEILNKLTKTDNEKINEIKNIYFNDCVITSSELQGRARRLLSYILHHYSNISIQTIDSFSNKVLNGFAFELNYPISYEITKNTEEYYEKSLEEFYASIESKRDAAFSDFINSMKSISLSENLKYIDKTLIANLKKFVEEEYAFQLIDDINKKIQTINIAKLANLYNKHLNQFDRSVKAAFKQYDNIYYTIRDDQITNTFDRLKRNRVSTLNKYFKNPFDNFEEPLKGSFFKKDTGTAKDDAKLINIYEQHKDYYIALKTLDITIKTLSITAVCVQLYQKLLQLKEDNHAVFFSDFTKEISKVIQNEQNVDFIYEKVGTKFNHFFIDEFQDTSELQFFNLLPLIHNAMASGKTNFIVGDPKQSIYKWRNANVNQFIDLSLEKKIHFTKLKKEFEALKPNIKVQQLDFNFRSTKRIIEFNNLIFNDLEFDGNTLIQKVYTDCIQRQGNGSETEGYVTIHSYMEKLNFQSEQLKTDILKQLNQAISNGFRQKDICIIFRENKNISEIIKLLADEKLQNGEKIEVISNEGLLIKNSTDVQFIISFFNLLINPNDTVASAYCYAYTNPDKSYKITTTESFYKSHLGSEEFQNSFGSRALVSKDIFQLALSIINYFHISTDVYVKIFLDEVNRFSNNISQIGKTISDFIIYWEKHQDQISIPSNPDKNAIKIMTIHKSKGLEFPIVLTFLTFQTGNNSQKYWYKTTSKFKINLPNEAPITMLNDLPLLLGINDIEYFDGGLANKIKEEEALETINLLYVLFTRAKHQLHIFTYNANTLYKGIIHGKIQSDKFKSIELKDAKNPEKLIGELFCYGAPSQYNIKKTAENNIISINIDNQNLLFNEKMYLTNTTNPYSDEHTELGIQMHKVFERINSNAYQNELKTAVTDGILTEEKAEVINPFFHRLVYSEELKVFFDSNNIQKVLNEYSLYVEYKDAEYRPDKIIFTKDNKIAILEFKTGEEANKHKAQIITYKAAIQKIYPDKTIVPFLIYFHEEKLAIKQIND